MKDKYGNNIQNFLKTINESTSDIKGYFKITKKNDNSKFAVFTINNEMEFSYLDSLFEINCDELTEKSFNDDSGMGNKGILFGDFSVDKAEIDQPANRDSHIKVPKLGTKKDGAF